MNVPDDKMLMLSGVQHFVFCPRQWALGHIDRQWVDNSLTIEGHILHKRVDNPEYRQKINDRITLRSLHIASYELGLYGISDAVELLPAPDGSPAITHPRYPGKYIPFPVEYKRGHHKTDLCDTMQLVCQAMCLEEMYNVPVDQGALFYWEIRRREEVVITADLRRMARAVAADMHTLFEAGELPLPLNSPKCRRCSLADLCMPQLKSLSKVDSYLRKNLYEETA